MSFFPAKEVWEGAFKSAISSSTGILIVQSTTGEIFNMHGIRHTIFLALGAIVFSELRYFNAWAQNGKS